jgi:hypothetical protein
MGVITVKKPNLFVKIAVVASSVLLVGALVAYRAGAFAWLGGSHGQAETVTSPGSAPTDPAFISSSKSIILTDPSKVINFKSSSKKPDTQSSQPANP